MDSNSPERDRVPLWRRLAPLALIGVGAVLAWVFAGDLLGQDAFVRHRADLVAWRDQNWALAALVFMLVYAGVVALSVPGAVWLTLGAGFLFGTWVGAALVVPAATLGASLIFLAARSALGAGLRARAGGFLARIEAGMRQGMISYLLILRLVPVVPFFVANLAPAFLGVPLRAFVWTTALGIIPATVVFASVGAGLGTVLDQGGAPDLGVIFAPHVLGPLLGLAALSALPLILKRRNAA